MPSYKNAKEAKKAMSGASMEEDGASISERKRQRKLKRAQNREDRRKYGYNKKRRAERKAEAQTKRKALAQAAIVGGDHQAGATKTDGDYHYSGAADGKQGASLSTKGLSKMNKQAKAIAKKAKAKAAMKKAAKMKTNQDGGGYAAKNPAAPAKQLARDQKDGGSMYGKKHGSSMYGKKHGSSMYGKKHGASMSGEKYDAKQAYNKNLSAKARLHYLENERHDKTSDGRHSILKHMKRF